MHADNANTKFVFFSAFLGGCVLAIGMACAPAARAQAAHPPQAFEVAVLRLEDPRTKVDYNRPDAPRQSNTFPTNRYTRFHTTLQNLIADAYQVAPGKIVGGPAWLADQHYDLSAKVEGSTRITFEQLRPMLQELLKQRVHLAVHKEQRIVSGYAMTIAKGGSKLKASGGAPFGVTDMGSQGEFRFRSSPATFVAQMIGSAVKQPVVDRTGLTGSYDCELKFAPENAPIDSPNVRYGSIFSALQEQLGLKLVPEKVPVDYLVVDRVDRVPLEN